MVSLLVPCWRTAEAGLGLELGLGLGRTPTTTDIPDPHPGGTVAVGGRTVSRVG